MAGRDHRRRKAPSEQVIVDNAAKSGDGYRLQTDGPHLVQSLRLDPEDLTTLDRIMAKLPSPEA